MKDLANNIQVKRAISPIRVSDNTAQVSQIIDRQGYDSLTFLIACGTLADSNATFAALLEEADESDFSDGAGVADADIISQLVGESPEAAASFQFDDDDEVRKLGYVGAKRYTRLTITPAGNTGNADIAAIAVLGHPNLGPVVQDAA